MRDDAATLSELQAKIRTLATVGDSGRGPRTGGTGTAVSCTMAQAQLHMSTSNNRSRKRKQANSKLDSSQVPARPVSAWMKAALRTRCGRASRTPLQSLALSLASLPEPVALQHRHSGTAKRTEKAEGLTQSHRQSHTRCKPSSLPSALQLLRRFSGRTDRQTQTIYKTSLTDLQQYVNTMLRCLGVTSHKSQVS